MKNSAAVWFPSVIYQFCHHQFRFDSNNVWQPIFIRLTVIYNSMFRHCCVSTCASYVGSQPSSLICFKHPTTHVNKEKTCVIVGLINIYQPIQRSLFHKLPAIHQIECSILCVNQYQIMTPSYPQDFIAVSQIKNSLFVLMERVMLSYSYPSVCTNTICNPLSIPPACKSRICLLYLFYIFR